MKVLVTALLFVTTISAVTASQREEGESPVFTKFHIAACAGYF
jgi:hypothetical protein